ncbi:hypothetical protein [Acinetobacter rongchengensis]|uniref:Uncharacterized protein n=1 Tax=Acinetobacter rongchengensis TaxID=2419601 RepID=A0A3A8EPC5_9GAMM|nr:hypothetical protein [Acinetobacter rongchengensis]RKG36732.1 hypothetical protein D7V20_13850 [Acinetobacter rongchengensis]
MSVKDYLVLSSIICIIFFAIFHQLASRIITKSPDLRGKLYGFDFFEKRSIDIPNIQAIMSVVTVVNIQYFLYAKKNPKYVFFKNRKHPLFPNLDTSVAIYIVNKYKKLNLYISLQAIFGILFLFLGCMFLFY